MLYSASIAPYLKPLKPLWKWSLAYLLTDEAYALTIIHYQEEDPASENGKDNRHWFFLGTGLALWLTWQLSTAGGIFLGVIIPESWPLDFTIVLTFIALLVPMLRDRAGLAAATVAGILAVLTLNVPLKLGLVIAALAGIITGVLVETKS